MGHRNQLAIICCCEKRSKLFSYFNLLFQNYIKKGNCQNKQMKQLHYCKEPTYDWQKQDCLMQSLILERNEHITKNIWNLFKDCVATDNDLSLQHLLRVKPMR